MKQFKRYLVPAISLLSPLTSVYAQDSSGKKGIAKVASSITDQLKDVAALVVAISFVAGLALILAGLFKFKQHKDNPTQIPVGTPIVLVSLGAAMIFLPGLVTVGG